MAQLFYVLEGELLLQIGDQVERAGGWDLCPELVERLEAEDPHIQLATDLAAKLAGVMWLGQPGSAVPESMDLT